MSQPQPVTPRPEAATNGQSQPATQPVAASGRYEACSECGAPLERQLIRTGGPPSLDGGPERINAWVRVYPELAREQAAAADARTGGETPFLCGIPLAVKDLYGVAGLPVTAA